MPEDKVRKRYLTSNFMVKTLQFSNSGISNIISQNTAFYKGFATLTSKSSICRYIYFILQNFKGGIESNRKTAWNTQSFLKVPSKKFDKNKPPRHQSQFAFFHFGKMETKSSYMSPRIAYRMCLIILTISELVAYEQKSICW